MSKYVRLLLMPMPGEHFGKWQLATKYIECAPHCNIHLPIPSYFHALQIILLTGRLASEESCCASAFAASARQEAHHMAACCHMIQESSLTHYGPCKHEILECAVVAWDYQMDVQCTSHYDV